MREVTKIFASETRDLKRELGEKLDRRQDLHTLPLPKSDLVNHVFDLIDNGRVREFPLKLRQFKLESLEQNPLVTPNLQNFNILSIHDQTKPDPTALLYIFKDQIKSGIRAAVEEWEYPPDSEVGPPRAERLKEIEKLDKEIAALQAKLDKINDIAQSEGINLKGIGVGSVEDFHTMKKARKITKVAQ